MPERTPVPGFGGVILGALCIVLGLSFGIPRVVDAVKRMTDLPEALVMPGEGSVTFEGPGTYKVYLEPDVVQDGAMSHAGNIPGFDVSIENRETGESLVLERPGHSENYNIGPRSGSLIFQFEVTEPGEYVVKAEYEAGVDGPRFGLLVGDLRIFQAVFGIFGGLGLVIGGTALGVVVIVLTLMKRSKVQREAAAGEGSE